jgi:hypothetical protein
MFDKKDKDRYPAKTTADYASLFLRKKELQSRQCVYISQKVHSTVAEILRIVASKDVSIGGYIDEIILEHLKMHKEEINGLYKRELQKGSNSLIEF